MIGNFPAALNFNRLFSNSTGSSVTNYQFSPIIGVVSALHPRLALCVNQGLGSTWLECGEYST